MATTFTARLVILIFALSIGKILVAELSARKKIDYVVWAGIIAVLVNVTGNLLLIPRMGISGAAIASTMSYSLLSLMIICLLAGDRGGVEKVDTLP